MASTPFRATPWYFFLTGAQRCHSGIVSDLGLEVNGGMGKQIVEYLALFKTCIYTSLESVIHRTAVIDNGIVDIATCEGCEFARYPPGTSKRHGRWPHNRWHRSHHRSIAVCWELNIGPDDPVDQIQMFHYKLILIISHVRHLLYATRWFLASTSSQSRMSSLHRYSLHIPMWASFRLNPKESANQR